jgi:pimeloyl-ACP methyl ester carboxylesterase
LLIALAGWGCSEIEQTQVDTSLKAATESRESSSPEAKHAAAARAAEGRHIFIAADGVQIPYVVRGNGETTLVLVHCWMCEGSFWDAQVPVLKELYRVVTLDLPGHGEGGDGRENWSIDAYGHDVARLIDQLGLERVVLVGHSMGGPVSLRAAALAGDWVEGIVAVDTLHDADFDMNQPMVQQMVEMFQADFKGACAMMVNQMFVEEGVEEIREEVMRKGCEEGNVEAGKALMASYASLDLPTLFREAGVPIRAINAAEPNPTRIENNRKYADFDAVLMEGVGHYLHMTQPDDFNELLLQTLEKILAQEAA